MEKIDIYDYRLTIEKDELLKIPHINLIVGHVLSKGFVLKEYGLCAEPFDKYITICHTDPDGTSSTKNPINTILIVTNGSTSTRKKKTYYHSISIKYINGVYYLCCLAQSSFYKKSTGATNTVYKSSENEIKIVLDEIFKDVRINK